MMLPRRVRTIYRKELTSILRDRRTLIAMIVVPIVLYPVLMIGSIQAVSFQADAMKEERIIVGAYGESLARGIRALIDNDAMVLHRNRGTNEANEGETDAPQSLERFEVVRFDSPETMKEAVRTRRIQIGLAVSAGMLKYDPGWTNEIELFPDRENVRSEFALKRLQELFEREADRVMAARKARLTLPETFDSPFALNVTNLSTPSSLLGQILPLILILMTITGAIYPAIDLTAGERERGTLESLMVSPTPVLELIVGKFLVVTTVAIMGAALNLASVSATVYFGGFDKLIATAGGGLPVGKMLFILVCLIPFAVLMSAIMIAVCSCARTFKEAQNYVTPVILAVLIPGGIAAMPATRLDGAMLVMPVGNMVLLAREFLLDAVVAPWRIAMVLISTVLYAGTAVAIAASVFGRESVVFADAASLTSTFSRRMVKPSARPTVPMGLLLVALLFPAWFFVQSSLSPQPGESAVHLLHATGWLMPLLFVLLPAAVLTYWKVGVRSSLSLRLPSFSHLLAGLMIGLSSWTVAHELNLFQQSLIGMPEGLARSMEAITTTLQAMPVPTVLVLIAVIPALCEELLFRGWLLGSLSASGRKWSAIIASAAIFALFHFIAFRFPVSLLLGVVLGYVVWQARSIWPAVVAHFLHNAILVLAAVRPGWLSGLGLPGDMEASHLPPHVLVIGGLLFTAGLIAVSRPSVRANERSLAAVAEG